MIIFDYEFISKKFLDFFEEDNSYYAEENILPEEDRFISAFAKSQKINWLDHDFVEKNEIQNPVSVKEKDYSLSYLGEIE
ncbi:MAG: hypothetical protein SFU98_07040 [Leptospiraceae bacterium]|nr:hypothetical protein [Leptospiraceae bacterium]